MGNKVLLFGFVTDRYVSEALLDERLLTGGEIII